MPLTLFAEHADAAKAEGSRIVDSKVFKHITKMATAFALGLVLHAVAYCQSKWEFGEIYSTPDGSVQFIMLVFNGYTAELPVLAGQILITSDGNTEQTFTFANNVTHYFSD